MPFPVPGVAIATDLAIVALQVKLVRDIGQYWGHKVDKDAAKTLLGGIGLVPPPDREHVGGRKRRDVTISHQIDVPRASERAARRDRRSGARRA